MRKVTILDAETFIATIQDEISRTAESPYFHRLHVILYVLQCASSYDAARLYGHSAEVFSTGFNGLSPTVSKGYGIGITLGAPVEFIYQRSENCHMESDFLLES